MKRTLIALAATAVLVGSALAASPGDVVNVPGITPVGQGTTVVSIGTLSGELLNWLALVFGAPVASFLVLWLRALAKKVGVDVSQAMSDKLQDIFKRGLQIEAAKVGADLDGKLDVSVQNKLLAGAVEYAKAHGADTIKDLASGNSTLGFLKSFDPNDPKVQEALAARATAALNEITPEAVIHTDPAQVAAAAPAAKQDAENVSAKVQANSAPANDQAATETKPPAENTARPASSPPLTI